MICRLPKIRCSIGGMICGMGLARRPTMNADSKIQNRGHSAVSRRAVLGMAAAAAFARPAIAQDRKARTLRFVLNYNLGFLDPNTTYPPTTTHGRPVFDTLYGVDNQIK